MVVEAKGMHAAELGEELEDGMSSGRLLKQVLSRPSWVSFIDCMKGDSEAELDMA